MHRSCIPDPVLAFTVVSDTYVKATVPSGVTTGFVTVTTPSVAQFR